MARTESQVKKQITDQVNANALFVLLAANPSQVAIFKAWIEIQAVTIIVFEQIVDVWKSIFEADILKAPVGSDYWVQQKVFEFQYDAITPQIMTLVNLAPQYTVIDPTKRIITRASVKTTGAQTVTVKVAKSNPPVILTAPEKASLQGYLTNGGNGTYAGRGVGIGFAGVRTIVLSANPDRLFLEATISYDGQYASVIQANVIAAINNYFANIPFDGIVKITSLTDAIQSVSGVSDILIKNCAIRAQATPFVNTTFLINSFTEVISNYPLYAGYVIGEDTGGQDLATKLTFTAI